MKKIIASILLFVILFPSFFSIVIGAETVSAASEDIKITSTADLPVTSCEGAMKDEETKGQLKTFRDKDATHLEQFALDLFELLLNAVNINTMEQLIFGNPYCIWFDGWGEEKMVFGLYPEKLYENIIKPGFYFFVSLLVIVICIMAMINGLKLMIPGASSKVSLSQEFLILIGVLIGIASYWIVIDLILNMNYAFVLTVADFLKNQGVDYSSFTLVTNLERLEFTDVIILFSEWLLLFFLNILYMIRLVIITVLMFAGGLVLLLVLFKPTREALGKWILDFVGAVFMQSIHSLYFAIVLLFVSLGDLSFFFKFGLLILFLPMSSMLLTMANFGSAIMATDGANKAVANVATAIKGAKMASRVGSKIKAPKSPNALSAGSTKIATLAKGSGGWQKAVGVASMAGGIAGATAGLVLGPSGTLIGSEVGSKLAGGALQAPRNITAGMKGILDTRNKVKSGALNPNNISDKRQLFGNYGESIGTMFGKSETGRKLGESLSGVTKERLLTSKELGGLGGVALTDIAQKYPESKVLFEQNNMGSGFYLDNGEVKMPISPIGQADGNLPDGFTRTIEYEPITPASTLSPEHLTSSPDMLKGDNMGLYRMSEAPMIRNDEDNSKVFDHTFDSSHYKPEQHCNMGDTSPSISTLNSNSNSPIDEGGNGRT